ncbi:MAG: alpha/beta fold hydrolase [Flavisolibacter sp.]
MSDNYLKWSINAVLSWQNLDTPTDLYPIHGKADRIFLYRKTHNDFTIHDGGHMMFWDRADEINKILLDILS